MTERENGTQTAAALTMRPFLIIWLGQAGSLLGSQLVQFALIWWLTRTTGSATVLARASLVALLPQILIGPLAGTLVDRWPRRAVLIGADGLIALATALLAALYAAGSVQLGHVYALLFIRALGSAFHWPAMQASTTLMVPKEHLARVGGMQQGLMGLSNIVIPPLGALAIEVLPMAGILAIDVGTALIAIGTLSIIAIPRPPRAAAGRLTLGADLAAGLRFIWGWQGLLRFVILGVLINLLGRAAGALSPLLVSEHLGGGAGALGLFQAVAGLGAVLGGVALGVWGAPRHRMVTTMGALALDGLAILIVGLSPAGAMRLVLGAVFASGLLETIVFGLTGAIAQTVVPPEMQGRVFALHTTMAQAATPLGLLIAGPVADAWGVPFWWLITGVMIMAVSASAFFQPALMQIEEGRPTGLASGRAA